MQRILRIQKRYIHLVQLQTIQDTVYLIQSGNHNSRIQLLRKLFLSDICSDPSIHHCIRLRSHHLHMQRLSQICYLHCMKQTASLVKLTIRQTNRDKRKLLHSLIIAALQLQHHRNRLHSHHPHLTRCIRTRIRNFLKLSILHQKIVLTVIHKIHKLLRFQNLISMRRQLYHCIRHHSDRLLWQRNFRIHPAILLMILTMKVMR